MGKRTPLVLASASPRRRDLLATLGLDFDVRPAEVDERRLRGEDPRAYVRRVARLKARAAAALAPRSAVVAADTAVVLDGDILGKPRSEAEAVRMLRRLAARRHRVLTGVAVISPGPPRVERCIVVRSTVRFTPITPAEARAYVATGEPLDKAGAYAIQGRGARFVRGISGSVTNVVGLPLAELHALLRRLDLAY